MESRRKLVLLTTIRPSSKYRLSPGKDEAQSFWNGYFALWHPAVVAQSEGPPVLGSQDEYDSPAAHHLFVIPESPYRYHSSEWNDRVEQAGSSSIIATASWQETIKQLQQAIDCPLEEEDWQSFAGLGMGYLLLEAYCDAQDHANALDAVHFYEVVRKAALCSNKTERRQHLEQAAHELQTSREVVNPSQLYQAVTLFLGGEVKASPWSDWLKSDLPFTVVSSAHWLHQWFIMNEGPDAEMLLQRLASGKIDWWGGHYHDQADALMPLTCWLANLEIGVNTARTRFQIKLESSGRTGFAAAPTMPALLHSFGIKRSLGFSNDGAVWPSSTNSLVSWRGPDSQLLESCTRKPEPLDNPETALHLGLLFHESTSSEYVGWVHLGLINTLVEIPIWFQCWAALHRLAPVFGQLGHLEQTIRDIPATEQFSPPGADDFQSDYLLELTGQNLTEQVTVKIPFPISRFANAHQNWRAWESANTLLALFKVITPRSEIATDLNSLQTAKDKLLNETGFGVELDTASLLGEIAVTLANRLSTNSSTASSGYLVFNPCSFTRKVPVNLPKAETLLPSPAWASQKAGCGIDAVIEVPPLGFAWIPNSVTKGAKVRIPKKTIVDGTTLINDYLILEVDSQTGGIRALKDAAKQIPRLGQQLVFAPGSSMQCDSVTTIRNGHAVGEIQCRGQLVDAHGGVLALFTQTYTLWAGRKLLEVDIILEPQQPVSGYPWHAYFASRWAWRDAHARLNKSVHWTKLTSLQTRPETPGFIELEMQQGKVAIFSGGLPYWQRYTSRMLDSLLLVEGEEERRFSFALALDDDLPHLVEQDWLTPIVAVPVDHGPPTAGPSSWLFHIDAPSVMLIDMHLFCETSSTVILRMVETFGYGTDAVLQCPRKPTKAAIVNSLHEEQRTLQVTDEGVALHVGCYEFLQLRLDFT